MPKTALMGSPLAVIGTVFRHRRTLAKTGAAVGGVLMLPILFLVMLPGLVFGDLSENTGALTSNTVISENIRASNQAIVEVLQESHDALLAKINAEIARLPEGDTASISDPYASSIIVNANQPIAQNFVLYSVYFALAGGYHAGYGGGFVNGHLYVHSHWH